VSSGNHGVGGVGEVFHLTADHLYGLVKLFERLREHLDRGQRAAVVTVSGVELTVEFVQLSVKLVNE